MASTSHDGAPKRPGDQRPGGLFGSGPPGKLAVWYVLGFLFLMTLGQALFVFEPGRAIPYSEFKALLQAGQIADVIVGETTITGTLESGDPTAAFSTNRIDDPDLVSELQQRGVTFSGETRNTWGAAVIGWILPLLFLVALWSFMFRRMGGAGGGVMSFARSRAKIYAEDDVKVSFADVAGVDEAADELR